MAAFNEIEYTHKLSVTETYVCKITEVLQSLFINFPDVLRCSDYGSIQK